jgi:hypothetical protein
MTRNITADEVHTCVVAIAILAWDTRFERGRQIGHNGAGLWAATFIYICLLFFFSFTIAVLPIW